MRTIPEAGVDASGGGEDPESRLGRRLLGTCFPRPPNRDEPGTTSEAHIFPKPIQRDDGSVARADQKIDVCHAPKKPSHEAFEVPVSEGDDCGFSSDRR